MSKWTIENCTTCGAYGPIWRTYRDKKTCKKCSEKVMQE